MRLVKTVEVERFRSCEQTILADLSDITSLAGLNNSGKSNVLRALNLFFNDETDPDTFLDLDVDYRLRPPSKKKKMIRVAVQFELPPKFHFRKGLEPVRDMLGSNFRVRKAWTLDAGEPAIEIDTGSGQFRRVVADEADRATQFLNLIAFRYIPNRAVPAQVVREHSRGVIRQLARRLLSRKGADVAPMIENMTAVAKEMVQPIADDMARVCAGMTDLELATPETVVDLLGQAGFRARLGSLGQIEDTSLGAGVQSLLMFHVLYMIDQGQFQGFGWKQAAIWAVEEPESSLHRLLQVRLANLLRAYALGEDSRFQILMTTHNDVFIFGADTGFLVTLDENLATMAETKSILTLAREAEAAEITSLPSPCLQFPFQTIVVTEGEIDAQILGRAAELRGLDGIKFIPPSELDPSLESDGVDNVKRFVQSHARSIPQRLTGHQLLILLDWEVSDDKVRAIATKYGPTGSVNVRKMDPNWADANVGDTFRGIERFYPESFLNAAETDGIVSLARKRNGTLTITPRDLNSAKRPLAERFRSQASLADCGPLIPALDWIDGVRNGTML